MLLDRTLNIETSLTAYQNAWQELINERGLPTFRATTLSIKVASKAALYSILENNADSIEQVHVGTVNERYIASAVLKQPYQDLAILKILERRTNSSDALGLDSIDYLVHDIDGTFEALSAVGLPVVKESNNVHAWLSLRFGNNNEFEAKFTDHLVLKVAIKELNMSIDALNLTV